MITLLSAAAALLAASSAFAEQRENKPFNTANGRTTTAAPRVFAVTTPGGGVSANSPAAAQAPAVTNAMIIGAPADGGRAFMGSGRPVAARGSSGRAVQRGGKAFWSRGRSAVGPADAPAPAPAETEEAPPNFSKPGALIRTTGQLPKYERAEEPRTHTTDAGEIVMSKRKAIDVGRGPSVQVGPRDTPPPPNPTGGSGGYGSGAVANSPSAASSNSGSKDNNGSGNNSKGTDSYDGKGSAKSVDDDPTGFNDAY